MNGDPDIVERLGLLIDGINMRPVAIAGGVVVPNHADGLESFLCAKIATSLLEVVIEKMSEEGWPVIVEHPIDGHLSIRPVGGVGLVLGACILVCRQLRFLGKIFRTRRSPVACVHYF